jgi:hypothetical protein
MRVGRAGAVHAMSKNKNKQKSQEPRVNSASSQNRAKPDSGRLSNATDPEAGNNRPSTGSVKEGSSASFQFEGD